MRNKATGERQRYCKPCFKPYKRAYYKRNKERLVQKANENRQKRFETRRELIRDLKSQPCVDCKQSFHWVCMDFDHVQEKRENVSQMVAHGYTVQEILEEVAKCDIICSNCHRLRTWKRKQEGIEISSSPTPPRRKGRH